MKCRLLALLVFLPLCFLSSVALAQDIIQNESNSEWSNIGPYFGQTFTATHPNEIDEIRVYIAGTLQHPVTLELYEGIGTAGELLDISTIFGGSTMERIFPMDSGLLVPGQEYTFMIALGGDDTNDPRRSTVAYYLDGGAFSPGTSGGRVYLFDLRFQILMKPLTCVVSPAAGFYEVFCQNGEIFTIDDFSCTFADNGDGTSTMTCPNGDTIVIADGADGEDGTSCTVEDNQDGTATLSCSDKTGAVLDFRTS